MFIGYTRSGHSLVGSLLDAHPEAVMAHEGRIFEVVPSLDALRAIAARQMERFGKVKATTRRDIKSAMAGVSGPTGRLQIRQREALFAYLIELAETQAGEGRPGWRLSSDGTPSEVSYQVPGASQGRYDRLRVIGTKRGQEPPVVWQANPAIFDELEALVRVPLRFVHVYRNPWDNVASMMRAAGPKAIQRYFNRAEQIRQIKALDRWPVLDVCLEDAIASPEAEIRRLLGWFALEADDALVSACASIVDQRPHPTRKLHEWDPREVKAVRRRMREIPWLERYPLRPWT